MSSPQHSRRTGKWCHALATALVALLALGGASLKNFSFALLVGILSGGYHSIFFSAPLVTIFRKRQLEAAARRRAAGASAASASGSRRVDAALQSRSGVAREDIVAARRARREKAKTERSPETGPARYKRKRDEAIAAAEERETYEGEDSQVDPLDAQESGLHDEALAQGHEEITLNLDGFETAEDEQSRAEER